MVLRDVAGPPDVSDMVWVVLAVLYCAAVMGMRRPSRMQLNSFLCPLHAVFHHVFIAVLDYKHMSTCCIYLSVFSGLLAAMNLF